MLDLCHSKVSNRSYILLTNMINFEVDWTMQNDSTHFDKVTFAISPFFHVQVCKQFLVAMPPAVLPFDWYTHMPLTDSRPGRWEGTCPTGSRLPVPNICRWNWIWSGERRHSGKHPLTLLVSISMFLATRFYILKSNKFLSKHFKWYSTKQDSQVKRTCLNHVSTYTFI